MGEYLSKFTGLEIDTRLDKTDSIDTLFAGLNTLNDVKADKDVIPDVSGFATKQELVSGLEPKADKTEIPDVSGFATQAQVQEVKAGLETQISGKQPVGEYALESDIPTIPTTLPNPNAITINGTSYDGTEAVSMTIEGGGDGGIPDAPADSKTYGRKNNLWDEVVIPPAYNDTQVRGLITANAESISTLQTSKADKTEIPDVSGFATKQEVTQGLSEKQPVGEYALESDIPTVPTVLPNPNALTINGTPYDGSEAVEMTIESGGGANLATDEQWEAGTSTDVAPTVFQAKGSIDSKQEKLESGVNIKTVNNQSLLGEGNIEISGGEGNGGITETNLLYSPITADGTYPLIKSVSDFDLYLTVFKYDSFAKAFPLIPEEDYFKYTLVNPFSGFDTENYLVTESGHLSEYTAWRMFTPNREEYGWSFNVPSWSILYKKNGTFNADMFSIWFYDYSSVYDFAPVGITLEVSNDGETWATVVSDNTPFTKNTLRTYKLSTYIEFSYLRVKVAGTTDQNLSYIEKIFIQDSRINNSFVTDYFIGDANSFSHEFGDVSFDSVNGTVTVSNLKSDAQITNISGVQSVGSASSALNEKLLNMDNEIDALWEAVNALKA